MARPPELLEDVLDGIDALLVFSPSGAYYDRVKDVEGADVVVVATENSVGAETFVELPLAFDDVKERIRFGIEGALSKGAVEDGDELGCAAPLFGDDIDMSRARRSTSPATPVSTTCSRTRGPNPASSGTSSRSPSNSGRRARRASPSARCSSSGAPGK